jgi:hypothetical protein
MSHILKIYSNNVRGQENQMFSFEERATIQKDTHRIIL